MSFLVPNLSALDARALRNQAEQLVATIDFGRQRSVMTGVQHRLSVDLDAGLYQLEWLQSDGPVEAEEVAEDAAPGTQQGSIQLSAPPAQELAYTAIPGIFGKLSELSEDAEITGVETPGGWVDLGEAYVYFERDGTSSFTTIVLAGNEGRELSIEILPLADTVRIIDEEI